MGKLFVLFLGSLLTSVAIAAPVIDTSQANSSSEQALVQPVRANVNQQVDTSDMTDKQRLARLENLVNAQGQMQVMQRLQQAQQQVEILQGQNEVLQHELKRLNRRQQYLYQQLSNGNKIAMPTKNTLLDSSVSADQAAYQQAYGLIAQRDYAGATKAFQEFIKKYPKSENVANALYWQGEVLAAQGNDKEAKVALQQLIKQFPNDTRVNDATLKLATIAINNDQLANARELLQVLIKQYPDSSAASIAANKLRLIKGQ